MKIRSRLDWISYEFGRGRLLKSLAEKATAVVLRKQTAPPMADSYYGEEAKTYHSRRVQQAHWPVEQRSVDSFLKMLPTGLDVLDMPIGTGRFVEMCLDRKHRVTGIDKSSDMIEAATVLLGARAREIDMDTGSALDLPFDAKVFDLSICYRFLGSVVPLEVAEAALREIARVTSEYAILELKHLQPGVPRRNGQTMKHRLYESEVDDLLSKQGFEILDVHKIFDREFEACRSVIAKVV